MGRLGGSRLHFSLFLNRTFLRTSVQCDSPALRIDHMCLIPSCGEHTSSANIPSWNLLVIIYCFVRSPYSFHNLRSSLRTVGRHVVRRFLPPFQLSPAPEAQYSPPLHPRPYQDRAETVCVLPPSCQAFVLREKTTQYMKSIFLGIALLKDDSCTTDDRNWNTFELGHQRDSRTL